MRSALWSLPFLAIIIALTFFSSGCSYDPDWAKEAKSGLANAKTASHYYLVAVNMPKREDLLSSGDKFLWDKLVTRAINGVQETAKTADEFRLLFTLVSERELDSLISTETFEAARKTAESYDDLITFTRPMLKDRPNDRVTYRLNDHPVPSSTLYAVNLVGYAENLDQLLAAYDVVKDDVDAVADAIKRAPTYCKTYEDWMKVRTTITERFGDTNIWSQVNEQMAKLATTADEVLRVYQHVSHETQAQLRVRLLERMKIGDSVGMSSLACIAHDDPLYPALLTRSLATTERAYLVSYYKLEYERIYGRDEDMLLKLTSAIVQRTTTVEQWHHLALFLPPDSPLASIALAEISMRLP